MPRYWAIDAADPQGHLLHCLRADLGDALASPTTGPVPVTMLNTLAGRQSESEFNSMLDSTIAGIYAASIT